MLYTFQYFNGFIDIADKRIEKAHEIKCFVMRDSEGSVRGYEVRGEPFELILVSYFSSPGFIFLTELSEIFFS